MGKLEELKSMVAEMFKDATEKTQIEQLAHINNSIDAVEKEQKDLEAKNGELINSYKELVQHTSFKDSKTVNDPVPNTTLPTVEDALAEFIRTNNQKKENN